MFLFFLNIMTNLFYFLIFLSFIVFCDIPEHFQYKIQDPATENLEWMIDLYDLICFELIVIVSVILMLLISLFYSPTHSYKNADDQLRYSKKFFSHSTELEVFWTVVPAILLITIAYPSFNLLYALDEDFNYIEYAIKIIGHQWYWTYEYHIGWKDVKFDSYMIDQKDLSRFRPGLSYTYSDELRFTRLLEVDNRLVLPAQSRIVLLITSADVLHSWTVPSFGIKVDACPGRLTKTNLLIKRPGIYFGQCSEICGINHGFMPITVQALPHKIGQCFAKYEGYEHATNFLKSTKKTFRVDTYEDLLFAHKIYNTFNLKTNFGYHKHGEQISVKSIGDDTELYKHNTNRRKMNYNVLKPKHLIEWSGKKNHTPEEIALFEERINKGRDENYYISKQEELAGLLRTLDILKDNVRIHQEIDKLDNVESSRETREYQQRVLIKLIEISTIKSEMAARKKYEIEHGIFNDYSKTDPLKSVKIDKKK